MDELEQYQRLKPERDELAADARDRVRARLSELAHTPQPSQPRRRVAAISLLAVAVALVAGFAVASSLDSGEETAPPVAGATPSQSTTSNLSLVVEPLLAAYELSSLPTGITAGPATEEMVQLGKDMEVAAVVQRFAGPEGVFATLAVVPEFSGELPPFGDPAAGTLALLVSTPVGEGLLVQATEVGGASVLYVVTDPGDLIILSSSRLDVAALQALAQELIQR